MPFVCGRKQITFIYAPIVTRNKFCFCSLKIKVLGAQKFKGFLLIFDFPDGINWPNKSFSNPENLRTSRELLVFSIY